LKFGNTCPVSRERRHPIGMQTLSKRDVFERYGVELTRFATSVVGPTDAQDVVSEALLRSLWSPGWDEVANQRAYLYRAVISQARMAHRSDSRRHHREREAGTIGTVATPIDGTVDVWDALNRLNVDERAVVFLTYWEDLTEPETAGRLEVSERTVRRRLGRARHKLGRLLDE
jgi:RNA polymerase sigma factor (sigma-70 family)